MSFARDFGCNPVQVRGCAAKEDDACPFACETQRGSPANAASRACNNSDAIFDTHIQDYSTLRVLDERYLHLFYFQNISARLSGHDERNLGDDGAKQYVGG